jgi:hypothetical protein
MWLFLDARLAEWKRIDPLKNADLFTADEDDESEEDQVKYRYSLKRFSYTWKSETTKFMPYVSLYSVVETELEPQEL